MDEVVVMCPAKINLFLNIVGKEENMHLLKMINQSVDLYDCLRIKANTSGNINLSCNNKSVPIDYRNTVYKAVLALKLYLGLPFGFDIDITKNIPIGAGLGGESTDAAGALIGILRLLNIPMDEEILLGIGAQVGADVPFCLIGDACLVKGFGEELKSIPRFGTQFLIIKPDFETSTEEMFKLYDKTCGIYKDFSVFITGLNDLEIVSDPRIADLKDYMACMGANFTNMSGSGSSVIGAFRDKKKLQLAYKAMKYYYKDYQGYIVNPCDGVKVLEKARLN